MKAFADRIAVVGDGRVIAEHRRSYGRHGQSLQLDPYMEILRRKPRAHFQGWREKDPPEWYGRFRRTMLNEDRKVKKFNDVLILRRDHPEPEIVDQAVETALCRHCAHYDAIRQPAFHKDVAWPPHQGLRFLIGFRCPGYNPLIRQAAGGGGRMSDVNMAMVQAYLT